MIEVKLTLEHEGEVHLFQQFVGFLRQARDNWKAQGGFDKPALPGNGEHTEAPADTNPTEAEALAAIGATKVAEAPVITDADLEEALMSYAKKKGVPAATELLAEFGIKRLPELQSKDRARFYAKAYA